MLAPGAATIPTRVLRRDLDLSVQALPDLADFVVFAVTSDLREDMMAILKKLKVELEIVPVPPTKFDPNI